MRAPATAMPRWIISLITSAATCCAHRIVDAAAGEQDVGVVAGRLRLLDQVIRIHADAVAADQARAERQEVPLGAGRFQHFGGVDAEPVEDQRELVDQRDVDVALGVLDHLGGLGHLEARGLVRAGGDDAAVQRIDEVGGLGRRAGGHLGDVGQAALAVAGIDALGAVADEEIVVEAQAGGALEFGHADFLGRAGIDGGFVDHHVAALEHAADACGWRSISGLKSGRLCSSIGVGTVTM